MNGFFVRKELEDYFVFQWSCEFCLDKIFCLIKKFEDYMGKIYRKCDCSCEEYYEMRDEYFEYFYSNLFLLCFEELSCFECFLNIEF